MHTWSKLLAIPACLAMVCTLPSCGVTWHTGDYVRKGSTVCKGFDTLHPVGGKIYVGADGASYYMQAPEVSYTTSPRLVKVNGTHGPKMGTPAPTGRTAWIQVKPRSSTACPPDIARKTGIRELPYNFSSWMFYKEVPALPGGARLWNTGETFQGTPSLEQAGRLEPHPPQKTSIAKKALAAPLDYVVDPVLTTASSAVYDVAVLGAAATYVAVGSATIIASVPVGIVTGGHVSLIRQMFGTPPSSRAPYDPDKEDLIIAQQRGTSFVYSYVPHGKGKAWHVTEPYLPAPYLRKVVDTGAPLVLTVHCRNMSDKDTEARLRAALVPLQAQGIRLHRALGGHDKKWFRLEGPF